VYNDHSIARGMHVQLDSIGAQLDRALERRNGVFRMRIMRAPMGDFFGGGASSPGQEFLGVVALGTMSAKHTGAPEAGQSPFPALTEDLPARLPFEAP